MTPDPLDRPASVLPLPTEADFLAQALRDLPACLADCRCPDHWHPLWLALKTTGLLRGVYQQAPLLWEMLSPHWVTGGHVLVAGAADTGSLEVLSQLFADRPARYTVLDLCEAPLRMVRAHAQAAALEVRTVQGDLADLPPDEPLDLAFIHYTLSFMDAPARARFLRTLKSRLSPHGVVLCAVRFAHPPHAPDPDAQPSPDWLQATQAQLDKVFGARPDLRDPLRAGLPAYALSRTRREQAMPHADRLVEEFRQAGLEVLQASARMAPQAAHDLPARSVVLSQVFLLR